MKITTLNFPELKQQEQLLVPLWWHHSKGSMLMLFTLQGKNKENIKQSAR